MMSVSTDEVHHMRASVLRALIFMTKPIKQEVLLDQLRGLGLLITHIPQGEQAGSSSSTGPTSPTQHLKKAWLKSYVSVYT